jgi:DNA mismatch repair protein MutS
VSSLLWPAGPQRAPGRQPWADDLALEPVVQALALKPRYAGVVRGVLAALCADPATIRFRHEVLGDLLALPAFAARLEEVLPSVTAAAGAGAQRWAGESGVFQIAGRLSDLEAYVAAVRALLAALDAFQADVRAQGWLALRAHLVALAAADEFQALEAELPALRAQLEQARSVTLGINLDDQLRPASATLLRVSAERFGSPRSLIGRLLGAEREAHLGQTPLRQAKGSPDEAKPPRQAFGPDRQLFLDLSQLLEEVVAPVEAALARFARAQGSLMSVLEGEVAFFLGAARLVRQLRAEGYALSLPTIAPPEGRIFTASALYNLELALRLRAEAARGRRSDGAERPPEAPVPADAAFDDAGRIFVLTGPNRGGKTTFTRAVGLAQVLAQAGLPVPAAAATVSPVDQIFTLFPAAEATRTGMGRLDQEAAQLAALFRSATARSLALLNEPFGSTSPHEAIGIARDVLGGLRLLGARAILVTHLHDLARDAASLNDAVPGASAVATLIAEVAPPADGEQEGAVRTYRIIRGLPEASSHAADIAAAHGLQLGQIASTLRERGALAEATGERGEGAGTEL